MSVFMYYVTLHNLILKLFWPLMINTSDYKHSYAYRLSETKYMYQIGSGVSSHLVQIVLAQWTKVMLMKRTQIFHINKGHNLVWSCLTYFPMTFQRHELDVNRVTSVWNMTYLVKSEARKQAWTDTQRVCTWSFWKLSFGL